MEFKPSAQTGEARGRPSDYRPEYAEQARKLCKYQGARDIDLAQFFECGISTLYRWRLEHEDFREAIKVGKDVMDDMVEASLLKRAMGYSHDAIKIVTSGGEVFREQIIEHYPPDSTAIIFWLKNRRPDRWRAEQPPIAPGGDDLAAQMAADKPVLSPDEPIPAAPVL